MFSAPDWHIYALPTLSKLGNAVDQTPLFSLRKNFITKEPGFEARGSLQPPHAMYPKMMSSENAVDSDWIL
jgi:hypothetical protein